MAARVQLREITSEERNRLLRIIRRGSGSVVTWRRAQIVLLAAQRMPSARIAEVVFSDPDTVREVIHNFNRDGFDSLYPRYRGGRPRTFSLPERRQITRIPLSVLDTAGDLSSAWAASAAAAATLWGDLPIVGYDSGDGLDTAHDAGFEGIGELVVWIN